MDYSMRNNSSSSGNGGAWSLTGPKTDWKVSAPHDIHSPPYKSANGTDSSSSANLVNLVILGAPGVGKTSIIQQFLWGTFDASYYPTGKKETYYPSVTIHDQQFDLKIVDIPDLPLLTVNNFNNLSDAQSYGLTDATAYVLVFDLLCPDSFEYVSGIHSQICDAQELENIPVIVIGNKTDKVELSLTSGRNSKRHKETHRHEEDYHHHGDHTDPGSEFSTSFHHHQSSSSHHRTYEKKSSNRRSYSKDSSKYSSSKYSSSSKYNDPSASKYVSKYRSVDVWGREAFLDKEIAERVISEWKATYRECAAKDAESVTELFKAIMELVEENQFQNAMNAEVNQKCVIL